jgi:transposase-like protein
MYSNPVHWQRLRERVLVRGESIRSVARREGMSRNTLKRLLTLDAPPRYSRGNQPNTSPVLKSVQPTISAKACWG